MGEANSDQAAVLDFMASPEAYEAGEAAVDRIETHASVVFLAESRAYKIKRAVRFPMSAMPACAMISCAPACI